MKSLIVAASTALFALLLFLQPTFGDDFFHRNAASSYVVAQVGIGGNAFYGAHWRRHYCRRDRGWRHHYRDDRYYRY